MHSAAAGDGCREKVAGGRKVQGEGCRGQVQGGGGRCRGSGAEARVQEEGCWGKGAGEKGQGAGLHLHVAMGVLPLQAIDALLELLGGSQHIHLLLALGNDSLVEPLHHPPLLSN